MIFRETEVVKRDGAITAKDYCALTEHALRFESEINLEYRQQSVNVKSVMGVLGAGLTNGARVSVVAKGSDEREALDEICRMLKGGFRE